MENMNIATLIVIGITAVFSIIGFSNGELFDRFKFNVYDILHRKQWDRMITSAFLHADWMHLLFNMLTLYFFAPIVITFLSVSKFVFIYLAAIIVGNTLTLFLYRHNNNYSAIGASGGVSGILFAAIALYPHIQINIMFIPIGIPGWIFAILYLAYSIYGMKNSVGNIGHAAHLGGAAAGMILGVAFYPATLYTNTLILIIMLIPLIALGYIVYKER